MAPSVVPARPARRPGVVATGALAVAVGVLAVAGCSSGGSDGAAAPAGTAAGTAPDTTTAAPGTTVDPLTAPIADSCGHDLSGLTSAAVGVDPATGTQRWRTEVPLADAYLLRDPSGDPLVPLVRRPVEVRLDPATGAVVGTPAAGAHEVLADVADSRGQGVGTLFVDGEPQPATITVDGLEISTARGETGQTTIALTAVDAASAAPAWRLELGAADAVGSLSPPVQFGDTVVVTVSPPVPSCY